MLTWKSGSRAIAALKPYKFNPRKITPERLEILKSSIEAIGFYDPIVIDVDDTIIAGHQRWNILKQLGFESVDVRYPEKKLTEKQFKRLNIQDNVPLGDWDKDILKEVFADEPIKDWGLDLDFDLSLDSEDDDEDDDVVVNKKKPVECPECGHEFVPE